MEILLNLKRSISDSIDYKLCIICQSISNDKLLHSSSHGLSTIINKAILRSDEDNRDIIK